MSFGWVQAQDATCEGLSRNQACHQSGTVQFNTGLQLGKNGNIISLNDFRSLLVESGGDPDLEERGRIEATTISGTNIRDGAHTNFSIVGSLDANEEVFLRGRNQAGSWVYVVIPDGASGWIRSDLLEIRGDVGLLDIVERQGAVESATTVTSTAVLQTQANFPDLIDAHNLTIVAFGNLRIDDASAPNEPPFSQLQVTATGGNNGILIQSPVTAGSGEITINGTRLELTAATIYIDFSDGMGVYPLEGTVFQIDSNGNRHQIDQGVTLQNGQSSAPSGELLQSVRSNVITGVYPTALLPREIPLDNLGIVVDEIRSDARWAMTYGMGTLDCGDGFAIADNSLLDVTVPRNLVWEDQQNAFELRVPASNGVLATIYPDETPAIYASGDTTILNDPPVTGSIEFVAVSPNQVEGVETTVYKDTSCVARIPFSMQMTGAIID